MTEGSVMNVDFLSASNGTPLSKRFWKDSHGSIQSDPHPRVRDVTSHRESLDSLEQFYDVIVQHATAGHCLLKGLLDRPLHNESRAGRTVPDAATQWMVLDNDGLHDLEPQGLIDLLGLGDVDYIVQYSSSAGIVPGKRGYHIFLLLDREYRPSDLKRWLKHQNLFIPDIGAQFSLTQTKTALRWPLDITVCQNDKLLYIAPASCDDGVLDEFVGERIQLVQRDSRRAHLEIPTSDKVNETAEHDRINQLRAREGLEQRQFRLKHTYDVDVMSNPDHCHVTGRKEERGFVYLNLNGGDSWGYYHHATDAKIIYNFKGEPNYLTKELLPEYYPDALARAQQARDAAKQEQARVAKLAYVADQKAATAVAKASSGRVQSSR